MLIWFIDHASPFEMEIRHLIQGFGYINMKTKLSNRGRGGDEGETGPTFGKGGGTEDGFWVPPRHNASEHKTSHNARPLSLTHLRYPGSHSG